MTAKASRKEVQSSAHSNRYLRHRCRGARRSCGVVRAEHAHGPGLGRRQNQRSQRGYRHDARRFRRLGDGDGQHAGRRGRLGAVRGWIAHRNPARSRKLRPALERHGDPVAGNRQPEVPVALDPRHGHLQRTAQQRLGHRHRDAIGGGATDAARPLPSHRRARRSDRHRPPGSSGRGLRGYRQQLGARAHDDDSRKPIRTGSGDCQGRSAGRSGQVGDRA